MLENSCQNLAGVGPTLAAKLAKCGLNRLQDLLFHLPYRYQDRTRITAIRDLRPGEHAVIVAQVAKIELKFAKRSSLICHVEDKTGILKLRFFHFNKAQMQQFTAGKTIRAFGEIRDFSNRLEMIHPEYQFLDPEQPCAVEERLTPIYPSTEGLSQNRLRQFVLQALALCQDTLESLEWLSPEMRAAQQFPSIAEALHCLHSPPPDIQLQSLEDGSHPARKRLAFEELLAENLSLKLAKQAREKDRAPSFAAEPGLLQQFRSSLPFALTQAQLRVGQEIALDLTKDRPMFRLVQGDVGSGKTLVALVAALQAVAAGYQVAFMAPTDILSEQHYQSLLRYLSPLAIRVERLSGKMKTRERRASLEAIREQQCHIAVGTHALFQDPVQFAKLGLLIIDEQHRFGVEQRLSLQEKSQVADRQAHQLHMTATPIPRSLAMTRFSHIEVSTIDELPRGRSPIQTAVMSQDKREAIIERLKMAIQQGRQVYWVCTLIEDSEKLQCIAATETESYLRTALPAAKIGLVHGRLKAEEKEQVMQAFKQGELDLLVATTVIEVGVDVPNASLMIIENAERLGLSQLHQLRGRVGRGTVASHCILLYQAPLSTVASQRLQLMRDSQDGFLIAEQDLKMRGAGEILGTKQSGYRQYKIARLDLDADLLPGLRPLAEQLLKEAPATAKRIVDRWLGDREDFLQG